MTGAEPRRQAPSPAVLAYVVGVVSAALIAAAVSLLPGSSPNPAVILFWTAAFLVGEAMSFKTPTGNGNISMAATIHLAAVPLVGLSVLIPAVWGSRLAANILIQRQSWYKALFNAAQVSLALILAFLTYRIIGGPHAAEWDQSSLPAVLSALAGASVGYYALNTGLVVGVLSVSSGAKYWSVWRNNFGYRVEMLAALALFLLAPVATMAYQSVGMLGIAFFFLPLLLIRDACKHETVLTRTHRARIGTEPRP